MFLGLPLMIQQCILMSSTPGRGNEGWIFKKELYFIFESYITIEETCFRFFIYTISYLANGNGTLGGLYRVLYGFLCFISLEGTFVIAFCFLCNLRSLIP